MNNCISNYLPNTPVSSTIPSIKDYILRYNEKMSYHFKYILNNFMGTVSHHYSLLNKPVFWKSEIINF